MASKGDNSCKPDSILKQRRSQKQACKQRENQRKLAEKLVKHDKAIVDQMPEEKQDAIRECLNNMNFSEAQFEALLFGTMSNIDASS